MEDLERVQARLANIQSVLPILSALRTVSLGRWQTAQRQQRATQQYGQQLQTILGWLNAYTPPASTIPAGPLVVMAIGSNRGLCGRFNSLIAGQVEQYLAEHRQAGQMVELGVLGQRLIRLLENRVQRLTWSAPLPRRAGDLVALAVDLSERWQARQEAGRLSGVDLIYHQPRGGGRYRAVVERCLPASPSATATIWTDQTGFPPIIETDERSLVGQAARQGLVLRVVGRLLESQIAEHAARFQLMEAASQNAERLVAELRLAVQTARRQAITRETQALAVGAGLLKTTPT